MKKRSIRYLRTAAKSDNGMKKVGRSKPRKGPDDLEEMHVEKITSMRSMTTVGKKKGSNKVLEEEDSEGGEEMELDGHQEVKKVGAIGK